MRRIWIATVAFLLVALFLAVAVLGAAPDGADVQSALALGIPGRENNTQTAPSALYERLFGTAPTAGVEKYLTARGISLRYNDAISAGCVSTDYRADTGTLSVTVRPYRYVAENGTEVTWLPTRACVEGQELALRESDGVYLATVDGLFRSENFDMTVDFSWSTEIPASVLDAIGNEPFRVGAAAKEALKAYEAAYAEYERLSAAYIAWQTYLEQKLAYDAYAEALRAYEEQTAAYAAYVEAKEIYDRESVAYGEWQEYYRDLAVYTEAYGKYTAYQSYLSGMEVAERKISLLESLHVSDSNRWRMHSSIVGSTVSKVIDNKDELVNVLHCSAEDVDLAKVSTEALRVLLKEYESIRQGKYDSDYEALKKKYEFFVLNYEDLKLHFTNLYSTLNGFLSNPFVLRALESEGQREHYLQFVGQLYVVSTCLDPDGERKSDWTVGGKRLEEVVEECQRLPDGDWDPRISPFPSFAEPAARPEKLTPPTSLMPAHKPIAPSPVEAPPTAPPSPVEDPDTKEIPPRCEEAPSEEPVRPVLDDVTLTLAQEVEAGALRPVDDSALEAKTLSFSSTLTRPVSILNEKLVTFYDIDGRLLRQELVSYGSALSYDPPEHAPSPAYDYRLLGWISAEGNEVDLRFISTDLDLYPNYEVTKRNYTVTWRVIGADGGVHESSSVWTYGALPTPSASVPCISYEENGYAYTFSGWSPEVTPVEGNAIYTGSVEKSPLRYPVTWVLGERTVTDVFSYGELPVFEGDVSVFSPSAAYTFLGWSPAVGVVEGAATYIARYEVTPYATSGSTALTVEESDACMTVLADTHAAVAVRTVLLRAKAAGKGLSVRWASGFELNLDAKSVGGLASSDCTRVVLQSFARGEDTVFELHFYNSLLKNAALGGATPVLRLPVTVEEDGRTSAFYLVRDGAEERVETEYLSVSAQTVLRRTYVYPLSVTPDANCNTGVLGYDASVGARISLRLPCLFGYEVTGATVTDASGNGIAVEDLSFVMPASPVRVTLTVEQIRYRVIFRSEGRVLSDREYLFGDEIVLPEVPKKSSTGNVAYTFSSWGTEVPTHATGEVREMIFDAVFLEQVKNIDYETGHNNNLLVEVILPVIGLCLLAVSATVTAVVLIRRRRR